MEKLILSFRTGENLCLVPRWSVSTRRAYVITGFGRFQSNDLCWLACYETLGAKISLTYRKKTFFFSFDDSYLLIA